MVYRLPASGGRRGEGTAGVEVDIRIVVRGAVLAESRPVWKSLSKLGPRTVNGVCYAPLCTGDRPSLGGGVSYTWVDAL